MKQLSVFAENRKGCMMHITDVLAKENINILGSVNYDSAEYGIIRMIVSDPEKGKDALEKAGYLCKLTMVLGAELEDEVGNLNSLLKIFDEMNVNVNYIYLSFNRETSKPILVIHTDEVMDVKDGLEAKGFMVL